MSESNLGDALKDFLNKSRIKTGVQSLQIHDAWEEIMGKTVAKYTEKLQVINKTLFVYTHIAPLKHELSYQKKLIIERVNEILGAGTIENVMIK